MRDLAAVRGAVIACMLLGHVTAAQAADGRQATAQEVVAKVREAALILARDGAAARRRACAGPRHQ